MRRTKLRHHHAATPSCRSHRAPPPPDATGLVGAASTRWSRPPVPIASTRTCDRTWRRSREKEPAQGRRRVAARAPLAPGPRTGREPSARAHALRDRAAALPARVVAMRAALRAERCGVVHAQGRQVASSDARHRPARRRRAGRRTRVCACYRWRSRRKDNGGAHHNTSTTGHAPAARSCSFHLATSSASRGSFVKSDPSSARMKSVRRSPSSPT